MTKESIPPSGWRLRPMRWLAALAFVVVIVLFFLFRLDRYFSLESLKEHRDELQARVDAHPGVAAALFVVVYTTVTGLSLPVAAILTVAGGMLFDLFWGSILASVASTAGAALAFLMSRYLLRDWVQRRWGKVLETIDRGVEKEGAFYLFTLRLVPGFPFFAINAAMGLTRMRLRTFWWVSQLGMLPGTIVYTFAGRQVSRLNRLEDAVSWEVLLAFALLGLLPLMLRSLLRLLQRRNQQAQPETEPEPSARRDDLNRSTHEGT